MMDLTIKEYAAKERVDERTVRRWIEKGAVKVRRTPGGGIRITPDRATHKAQNDSAR
jgi:predicted site-specific integrase-resolvase